MEKSETRATLLWVFIEAITIWGILHMWQQAPCLSFFLIIQDKVVNQIFTVPSLFYFLKWLRALNFLKIQLKDLIECLLPVINPRLKRQNRSTIFRWAGLYHLPGHMFWFPIDYGINSCQEYISAGSDLTTQGQTSPTSSFPEVFKVVCLIKLWITFWVLLSLDSYTVSFILDLLSLKWFKK